MPTMPVEFVAGNSVKNFWRVFFGYAQPVIAHRDQRISPRAPSAYPNCRTIRRIFYRIGNQIRYYLIQRPCVGHYILRQILQIGGYLMIGGQFLLAFAYVCNQRAQIARARL